MRIWNRIVVAMLLLGSASCSRTPQLIDYPLIGPDDADYLNNVFSAPIVIVATVQSDALVRAPIPSHWNAGILLQLRKVNVLVENTLRGQSASRIATIYYFAWYRGTNGNRPLGFWNGGGRRIVWLRRDSGVLRTACDGADHCTMPVYSGAHPHYQADPRRPLGYALADIWLTRGQGTTDNDFARQVNWGAPSTVPEAYLIQKLQRLAATDAPAVRAAACRQLASYHQECIESAIPGSGDRGAT